MADSEAIQVVEPTFLPVAADINSAADQLWSGIYMRPSLSTITDAIDQFLWKAERASGSLGVFRGFFAEDAATFKDAGMAIIEEDKRIALEAFNSLRAT